jgi:hypothetical protein
VLESVSTSHMDRRHFIPKPYTLDVELVGSAKFDNRLARISARALSPPAHLRLREELQKFEKVLWLFSPIQNFK